MENNLQAKQILEKSVLIWACVVTKKPLRLIVHMPHCLCFQMNQMFYLFRKITFYLSINISNDYLKHIGKLL